MIPEQKENDWIVGILGNPQLSTADLKAAGFSADNTSLLNESEYLKSPKITDNPIFKNENGEFDKTKFHDFYERAQLTYNILSNDTYLDKMLKDQTTFSFDDWLVPIDQRQKATDMVTYTKTPNPNRTNTSLVRLGVTDNPRWSISELAQREKVAANPVEAGDDYSKIIWHEAPNDSWTTDFFDTRVLATYDNDGEHIDLVTGEKVQHKKGDYKLNENGTYYYENLDGRDIYGKQVLNKMNTLTKDGSWINNYDFFDSDDLNEKSVGGTIMKNLALVGSMFIPYVGPWIAGASVATQLVGLAGTLGKMLTGSDSPTFSAMEGWSKSVNRQTAKSQFAQENTWCWENFISLIGDVTGQLKEQRFLFEFAPALFKKSSAVTAEGLSQAGREKFIAEQIDKYKDINNLKLAQLIEGGATPQQLSAFNTAASLNKFRAEADYDKFVQAYQKIGSVLSKGYMTAVTVADTYGEAKSEGKATDFEATMLTLGYAAAEAALLNTGIGEWILPELKGEGLKRRKIIEAFANAPKEIKNSVPNRANKKQLAKYWFKKGKEIATDVMSLGKGTLGSAVSGGLGEAIEETTEELLADFSKSCYNAVQYLQGDEGRMSAWDNMFDRYAMSFLGGAVGGGLTALGTDFKLNRQDITPEAARQQLVYDLRNNKKQDYIKTLEKMEIANPYLSFESDGKSFKPSSKSVRSMDQDVKRAFVQQLDIYDNIIKAEGLKVSDQSLLDTQIFKDVALQGLQNSTVSSLFLQDFNSIVSNILKTQESIQNINNKYKDSDKKLTDEDNKEIVTLTKELNDLRLKKDKYLDGSLAMDYISKAMFDLTPGFSEYYSNSLFKDYVKQQYKKNINDLSSEDLKEARAKFDNWKQTDYKNRISDITPIYLNWARNSGLFIQEYAKNYDSIRRNRSIYDLIKSTLKRQDQLNAGAYTEENKIDQAADLDAFMDAVQSEYQTSKAGATLIFSGNNETLKQQLLELSQNKKGNSQKISDLINRELSFNLDKYFQQFKTSSINPEIKHEILNSLQALKEWSGKQQLPVRDINISNILEEFDNYGYNGINSNTKISELKAKVQAMDLLGILGNADTLIAYAENQGLQNPTLQDIENIQKQFGVIDSNIDLYTREINNSTYTDAIQFVQNHIQANSQKGNLNISELIEKINFILDENRGDISGVNFDEVIGQIDDAVTSINFAKGLVLGAQTSTDGADIGNLLGYNKTLNEIAKKNRVTDWEALPEITMEDAAIISQDLDLIKNKLIQAKAIYAINQGKKLNLVNNTAINKNFIEYNRLSDFIVNIGDDWKERDRLQDAINNALTLKEFAPTRNQKGISAQQRDSIELERVAISDAVHDFFQANEDLIKQGKLKDLFRKGFDLYSSTNQIISQNTEALEDQNFVYWLASRAALKQSDFLKKFKTVIDGEVAPLPTQEESIFQGLAEVLNGDMTTQFMEAFKQAAIENFQESSDTIKEDILRNKLGVNTAEEIRKFINDNQIVNEDIIPKFENIYLIEGIPGAGKSQAVNYYITKMLPKELLENSWFVHNSQKAADEQVKKLGLKKAFSKNPFMTTIYSNYNTSRDTNKYGYRLYDKEDWIKDSTGKIVYKHQSDDIAPENVPSLIIIDEISHYDEADLSLINDFAKKYGITVLTAGDFDQSSSKAMVERYENTELQLSPKRSFFKHAPKLGVSMRTSNSQLDKTLASFRTTDENDVVQTYYYEQPGNFTGAKVVFDKDEAKTTIDNIMSQVSDKDKVGLIYYDMESPLYQYMNEKYNGRFEAFRGTAAQGLEGRFYIADFTGSDELSRKKDLYTAISRAEQGALVYGSELTKIKSNRENVVTMSSFSKAGIARFSENRKKFLEQNYPESVNLVKIDRQGIKTVITTPPPTKVPPLIATQDELTLPTNYGEKTVEALNEKQSEQPIPELGEDFVYLLHSHNTFELGMKEKDGKLVFEDEISRYRYRIDSAIGLAKIFELDWKNPVKDAEFYKNIIKEVRGYLFTSTSKPDLILALSSVFNPDESNPNLEVTNVEFGLMSAPNISARNSDQKWGYGQDAKQFGIFDKSNDERTIGNANPSEESQHINRKAINAIITLANGKRVAIPLFTLGNLETYTRNPTSEIGIKLKALFEQNPDPYNFHKAILQDEELSKIPEVANLATLFLFTNGGYFKIDNESWIPSKGLKNWGIQVNQNAISGTKFEFNGITSTISEAQDYSGFIFSKGVYTSMQDLSDANGNPIKFANKGHAFILVTQNPLLSSDQLMREQYERQLINPNENKEVTLVYVVPPKVPVEDYLINLRNLIKETDSDKRKTIKKLGSRLTSYQIWDKLLPELKSNNPLFNNLEDELKTKIIETVERLQQLEKSSPELLVNEVSTEETWKGTGKPTQSIQQHLNYALLKCYIDAHISNVLLDKVNELANILRERGMGEFYYSTKFKEKIPPKDQVMVQLESDNYTINGLPFTINAKLDSSLFSQNKDFNTIIESFVNKIIPANDKIPRDYSSDTFGFINPNSSQPKRDTFSIEPNWYNINQITISGEGISVDGRIKNFTPEYVDKLKSALLINGKIPTSKEIFELYRPYHFDQINRTNADLMYNNIIAYLSGDAVLPDGYNIYNMIQGDVNRTMNEFNARDSKSKYFFNTASDRVFKVEFSEDQIDKAGLEKFILDTSIRTDEYNLGNSLTLRINRENQTAELIKEASQGQDSSMYDEMFLEDGSPIYNLFSNIGYMSEFLDYQGAYGWNTVSEMQGSEVVDELTNIFKAMPDNDTNKEELKQLLNYLAQDNEYCTNIFRNI